MSAGEFVKSIYETNKGNFCAVKVQPETLAAVMDGVTNAAGAGPVNQEASASVSSGKRTIGVNCRTVTLRWTGDAPDGYSGDDVVIPALTPAFYEACDPNAVGVTGTYLESGVIPVGRSPETVK